MSELEDLRAEVRQIGEWQREVCDIFGYDSGEAGNVEEVLTYLPFWKGEAVGIREALADEAEAKVAAVEALADEAESLAATYSRCDSTHDLHARLWGDVARRTRVALASVGLTE